MRHFVLIIYLTFIPVTNAQAQTSAPGENHSPPLNQTADLEHRKAVDLYQIGIQSYQKNNWTEAQSFFTQALNQEPLNYLILYNLGLTDFKLGLKGQAVASWRRALYLNPQFAPARKALDFGLKKMGPLSTHSFSQWDFLRIEILSLFTFNQVLLLSGLLLLGTGFFLLRFWSQRKQALTNEMPLPTPSYAGMIMGFLLLIVALLTVGKGVDYLSPRATVIVERVPIRSGPNESDVSLFEVLEGQEVIIKKVSGDWVQVNYPGGLTGWVLKQTIFYSSGRQPW